MENFSSGKISISELSDAKIDFSKIVKIFDFEISENWERAINNLILTVGNKEIDKNYREDMTNPVLFVR
jgi:hypothetical protein